jgi:hypothetical protein
MTFANRFARSVALSALALGTMGVVNAQNGTNYHVLNNNGDAAFVGIGAGGAQTAADGIGTWIPGEDVRGSQQVDFGAPDGIQFSYRNVTFRENACVFGAGTSGFVQLRFPAIAFVELNGLNANIPVVFTRPVCATITTSFMAYGVGPSSTTSFLAAALPSGVGGATILLPNNGLVITGGGTGPGTATLVGFGSGQLPASGSLASGCYVVQFQWVASAVPYLDNIDAVWHYSINSDDGNQYWVMSDDEMNLWQAMTVQTDAGFTVVPGFFGVIEYDMNISSLEANTHAALAPNGINQQGPYYNQTENMVGGGGPHLGFDVGRGSRAASFGGLGGVKVPPGLGGLGSGAQDPAYDPDTNNSMTLSFVTWDNKPNTSGDGIGSGRVTWISIDLAQIGGVSPETDPNITKAGGTIRVPVIGAGFIQPTTQLGLSVFLHTTNLAPSGWPDPNGIPSGAFGVPASAGGSTTLILNPFVSSIPCNIGIPVNLTYGTSGNQGAPFLQWNPAVGDVSGTKELYLWK